MSTIRFDDTQEAARRVALYPELLEALLAVEPYIDTIVCYASTLDEHEGNRVALRVRQALAKADKGEA